jgi:hypothetical protein
MAVAGGGALPQGQGGGENASDIRVSHLVLRAAT